MPNPIGSRGGQPVTTPEEIRIPDPKTKSVSSKDAGSGSAGPETKVDLHPEVSPERATVDRLLGNDKFQIPAANSANKARTNASAGMEPGSVGKDYVLELADKSPKELRTWYEHASNSSKRRVQSAFAKIDATTLGKTERSKIEKLGKDLNGLQLEHNQKWATDHYGKMSERELVHDLQRKSPKQIMEDLGSLSTGSIKGGERVRKKFVDALRTGMDTRQPGTSPGVNYPMISPGHIYEAATRYNGPGSDLVKAEAAKMLYDNTAAAAERKFPAPDPKLKDGPDIMKDLYKAKSKSVAEDRQDYVRSQLAKGAPTLKRLMDSNPAGFVKQMENMKGGAKVLPEILTAVARNEYDKDPRKGAEFLGNVIGSTASEFGKTVAGSDWKAARSMGNDLGFVLGAAEVAIGNVAREEHAKIDLGKDVLGFATNIIKKSKIPGASQIAEVSDKVVGQLAKNEKGEVDGWRDQIYFGFKALILETYDKVSPNGDYPLASAEGQVHQKNQDVYEVGYQERYREVLKGN